MALNAWSELTKGSNPASSNQWVKFEHSAESGVHGLLQQAGEVPREDLGDEVRIEEADVEVEVGHELRLWAGTTSQRDEHAQRSGRPEGPDGGVEGPSASHSGHGAAAKEPGGEVERAQRLGLASRSVGGRGWADSRGGRRLAARNMERGCIHGWSAGGRE